MAVKLATFIMAIRGLIARKSPSMATLRNQFGVSLKFATFMMVTQQMRAF
jgi:hypothetical protein